MPEHRAFSLVSTGGHAPPPVLVGVQAEGRLDATLLSLTLRQTYRNTGSQALEVVYTFPLPLRSVLLGFACELNGQRQDGVVVPRQQAERQYEAALQEGDAPVMLEAHGDGLHTANIGNLMPGDELVIECRLAELLSFEQGRLRVSIPTTIAPRHGPPAAAGLQPQQAPEVDLAADYPLNLRLTLGPTLAGAHAHSPTHAMAVHPADGAALALQLQPGARLDRDLVVIVTPREPQPSLLVRAEDPFDTAAPVVMMAALRPPLAPARRAIRLKLLVDCSGSMQGDSIESARAALRGVVAALEDDDELSLSRFGTSVEHLLPPSRARAQTLRHLQPLVDGVHADLGGTEMALALAEVFKLPGSQAHEGGDVLMITDGNIWHAEATVAEARRSGHRVFAIGVGAAPAEGVLRALAQATGGACDFATPGEAVATAARHMLQRMRQPVHTQVRIDWGRTPVWSCGPAASVFGGDTVLAFAGFDRPIEPGAVRLLAEEAPGRSVELARAEADAPCPGDDLARMAAHRRMAEDSRVDAPALATRYQLLGAHTHCVLVHRRAEQDRSTEAARLHRVGSMLAAGWGGFGRVLQEAPRYALSSRGGFAASFCATEAQFFAPCAIDLFGQPQSLGDTARAVVEQMVRHGLDGLGPSGLRQPDPEVLQAVHDVAALLPDGRMAWLLLALWVAERPQAPQEPAMQERLRQWLAAMAPALVSAALAVFEQRLGGHATHDRSRP